jgi:hypothetical protein
MKSSNSDDGDDSDCSRILIRKQCSDYVINDTRCRKE